MDDCILHAVSSVIPVGYDVILFVIISVPTEMICWYLRSISIIACGSLYGTCTKLYNAC